MCVAEALTQESMKKAAESVSAGMFPWERRQMDGGGTPLNTFERVYWLAFGGAIAFLIGTNVYRYWSSKQEVKACIQGNSFSIAHTTLLILQMVSGAFVQVDEDTARKKDEIALKLAVGDINVLQSEDVFEGLTPKVRTTGP